MPAAHRRGHPGTGHGPPTRPGRPTRDEEVERLLASGATLVADHRRPDGTGWATLADLEGNEFCVERSAAERAASKVTGNGVAGHGPRKTGSDP